MCPSNTEYFLWQHSALQAGHVNLKLSCKSKMDLEDSNS